MAKPEWGTKRQCQSCGAKYYDFARTPIVCPACSATFDPEAILKARRPRPGAAAKKERLAPVPDAAEAVPAEADDETEDAAVEEVAEDEVVDDADEAVEAEEIADEEDDLMEDTSELGEDDEDVEDIVEEEPEEER